MVIDRRYLKTSLPVGLENKDAMLWLMISSSSDERGKPSIDKFFRVKNLSLLLRLLKLLSCYCKLLTLNAVTHKILRDTKLLGKIDSHILGTDKKVENLGAECTPDQLQIACNR